MRFLIILIIATMPLIAADGTPPAKSPNGHDQAGHDQHPPLTDAEKAKFEEIHALRQQLEQKHQELIALLEKDHPKMAEEMRHHLEEMKQHHGGPGQGHPPGGPGGDQGGGPGGGAPGGAQGSHPQRASRN